ncbi:hypothetical protein LTR41_011606, partial [Exophiala xenobiotica]
LGHGECATVLRHDLGPENVPKRFGGDLYWEFGGSPELSPDAKPLSKKWVDKWLEGPLRIINGPGEQWRIIAVGSQNGELSKRGVIGGQRVIHLHKLVRPRHNIMVIKSQQKQSLCATRILQQVKQASTESLVQLPYKFITGKQEMDELEEMDRPPIPRNVLEKAWFWLA